MNVDNVTISLELDLLKKVDHLIKERVFLSRSQAIQAAIHEKFSRLDRNRLVRECARLDKESEQALADEGLTSEISERLAY